ncbi:glycosyltransferase family 39 protein [Paroceanicella profunda]|uniref:Glycosyltransferase family 39 protein n=1 Tax=Paroceanicella profunda TaxID=2579971 RepID=A0A5B8FWB4_9RHOB|nr:glycosyltransferase family 39 protein [Paroceanicella profunda]QDL90779.1 glycosyltransferase family 39 protein [Paroceanicella profunda]
MQGLPGRIETAALAALGWAEASAPRRAALIGLLALLTLLPGLAALPPTDRDESRFVQASRQMIETGDLIDIRFQDEPRWKKPAGIYWLQAASASAFGGAQAPVWAYRLPSALAVFLAGLLTIWTLLPLAGQRAATLAGAMVSTALLVVVEGHIAKTDATLLACVMLAQGALARIRTRAVTRFDWRHLLFWGALGLGVLVKGPVILLSAGGTLLWLTVTERAPRRLLELKPLPGFGLLILLTLPWAVAIWLRTGGAFFDEAVGTDLLGKVTAGAEKHWGPPGYYLATVWGTFWPWTPLALFAAPFVWRARASTAMRFLLGWALPFWLVFALVSTKLPHYILPILPALAGMIALWATAPDRAVPGRLRPLFAAGLFALVGGLLGLAGLIGPTVLEGTVSAPGVLLALLALGAVALGARAIARMQVHAYIGSALIAGLCLYASILQYTLPALHSVFLSPRLAEARARFDACTDRPLVSVGYREPSLVVAGGTDTMLADAGEAADLLRSQDGWLVFFEESRGFALDRFIAEQNLPLTTLQTIHGFNYNRGKPTTLHLVARPGDPRLAGCTPAPAPRADAPPPGPDATGAAIQPPSG